MENGTLLGRRMISGGALTMLFVASLALMAIFAYAPEGKPASRPVAQLAAIGLVDDDGNQGLFKVTGLVPGKSAIRCIQVRYGGPSLAGTVYVAASGITGALAANLRIKVEQGSGGGFASCTGFVVSSTIYDGSLSSLVDANPAAPKTSTGWRPAASDQRTYRITATLRDTVTAQNQKSAATFRWFLVGAPPASPTAASTSPTAASASPTAASASPTPTARAESSPTDTAPTDAVLADPVISSAGVTPTATRESPDAVVPSPSQSAAAAAPPTTTRKGPSPVARVREALADLGRNITTVAVRTSTHSALPVTGLVVLIAFIAVQNRIDRMDPKLALAPATDPRLVFVDPAQLDAAVSEPAPPDPDEAAP